MPLAIKERALVLVKAFPQPSQKYEETVCCAGVTDSGTFVRLYPVRYRHLKREQKFERWDVIEYEADRPVDDFRPESRHVNEGSITIVQSGSNLTERQKVELWARHVRGSMADLKAQNLADHTSLGIVRPDAGSVRFRHKRLQESSQRDRQLREAFHQVSLIEGEGRLPALPVEYDFSYRFTCGGNQHDMKIHDWEVQAAFFSYKQRYGPEALAQLTAVYQNDIPGRNLHFVMGTMKAHPRQFIIIGLLRSGLSPEDVLRQGSLI